MQLDEFLLSNQLKLDKIHNGFRYTKNILNSQFEIIWRIYYGNGEHLTKFNIMTNRDNNKYYKLYKFGTCIGDNIMTFDHEPVTKILETMDIDKIIDILSAV